jgi:hypothetical protein
MYVKWPLVSLRLRATKFNFQVTVITAPGTGAGVVARNRPTHTQPPPPPAGTQSAATQWIAKQQLARQGTMCFWRVPVGQHKSAQRHEGQNCPGHDLGWHRGRSTKREQKDTPSQNLKFAHTMFLSPEGGTMGHWVGA